MLTACGSQGRRNQRPNHTSGDVQPGLMHEALSGSGAARVALIKRRGEGRPPGGGDSWTEVGGGGAGRRSPEWAEARGESAQGGQDPRPKGQQPWDSSKAVQRSSSQRPAHQCLRQFRIPDGEDNVWRPSLCTGILASEPAPLYPAERTHLSENSRAQAHGSSSLGGPWMGSIVPGP